MGCPSRSPEQTGVSPQGLPVPISSVTARGVPSCQLLVLPTDLPAHNPTRLHRVDVGQGSRVTKCGLTEQHVEVPDCQASVCFTVSPWEGFHPGRLRILCFPNSSSGKQEKNRILWALLGQVVRLPALTFGNTCAFRCHADVQSEVLNTNLSPHLRFQRTVFS